MAGQIGIVSKAGPRDGAGAAGVLPLGSRRQAVSGPAEIVIRQTHPRPNLVCGRKTLLALRNAFQLAEPPAIPGCLEPANGIGREIWLARETLGLRNAEALAVVGKVSRSDFTRANCKRAVDAATVEILHKRVMPFRPLRSHQKLHRPGNNRESLTVTVDIPATFAARRRLTAQLTDGSLQPFLLAPLPQQPVGCTVQASIGIGAKFRADLLHEGLPSSR